MPFLGLLILLVGAYLLDSSVENRPPLGTLRKLLEDPSDLAGTLASTKGTWVILDGGAGSGGSSESSTSSGTGTDTASSKRASETGQSGHLTDDQLQRISFSSSNRLIPAAANALEQLNNQYRARFGHNMVITDSYRSYAQQIITKAKKGALAATPGTSVHGWGRAVDLGDGMTSYTSPQYAWMKANAPKFGWTHPAWAEPTGSKHEPWHWEFNG